MNGASNQLTADERRLLHDFAVTGFALLLGSSTPEIVLDLTRRKLVEWHWNGGIPVYEVTESGRAALNATEKR